MAELKFKLVFDGYWKDKNVVNVPADVGIYCVYTYTNNEVNNKQRMQIQKLIFIGSTDDAKATVLKHEQSGDYASHTINRKKLCYSFAPLEKGSCNLVRSALIRTLNPIENQNDKTLVPNEAMEITTEGQNSQMKGAMMIPKS